MGNLCSQEAPAPVNSVGVKETPALPPAAACGSHARDLALPVAPIDPCLLPRDSRPEAPSSHSSRTDELRLSNPLLYETDLRPAKRDALTDFQVQTMLRMTCSPLEVLHDLQLLSLIGSGGFAAVFAGLWRGNGDVAVKLCVTNATEEGRLPGRAITEAILSKGLAHPSLIQTYDVRCCRITQSFLDFVNRPIPVEELMQVPDAVPRHSATAVIRTDGKGNECNPMELTLSQQSKHQEGVAARHLAVSRLVQEANNNSTSGNSTGLGQCPLKPEDSLTPIRPGAGRNSLDMCSGSNQSWDDFGSLLDLQNSQPVSWAEVLEMLQASAGQVLTVLIMQRAKLGTLWQAIQKGLFQPLPGMPHHEVYKRQRAFMRTACEVAAGLEFLHKHNVVHGDLKPSNCLLNESRSDARGFSAAVSDFGLSTLTCPTLDESTDAAPGTAPYMAPELLQNSPLSPASDIYAFGIMLFEMASSSRAYSGLKLVQLTRLVLDEDRRPLWPPDGMPEMGHLYLKCVARLPENRPTSSQIVRLLQRLERSLQKQTRAARRVRQQDSQGTCVNSATSATPVQDHSAAAAQHHPPSAPGVT